jgi:hypothetical protein
MIFKNMNLDWLSCIQEFGFPLQMVNMTWFINIQKGWPLSDTKPTIINPQVLKLGQKVLHDGLQTFFSYLVDMHRPTPKMQEVMEFQNS